MKQTELEICLNDVDVLLDSHAAEQTEVIAAHSILPIIQTVLKYLCALELEDADDGEEDEDEQPQFVYISVPLWSRLSEHLWELVASEALRELDSELHKESIYLAAELQGQIERRPASDILLELVPELFEEGSLVPDPSESSGPLKETELSVETETPAEASSVVATDKDGGKS